MPDAFAAQREYLEAFFALLLHELFRVAPRYVLRLAPIDEDVSHLAHIKPVLATLLNEDFALLCRRHLLVAEL